MSRDPEQVQQLRRVRSRLADPIARFVLATPFGCTWHSGELAAAVGGNPSSVDRILRDLREQSVARALAGESLPADFSYRVVSRSRSLYERVALPPRRQYQPAVQRALPCMEARA